LEGGKKVSERLLGEIKGPEVVRKGNERIHGRKLTRKKNNRNWVAQGGESQRGARGVNLIGFGGETVCSGAGHLK